MKIKIRYKSYEEVQNLPRPKHRPPKKPWHLLSGLIRVLSIPDLLATRFRYTVEGEIPREPCLILMNHSSFIDLKIASKIFFPRRHCIVCTTDGMVGKNWLMRRIGCIPTQKYVTDLTLIRDIRYALTEKKTNVLMFPEAGYSFDGCATALPDTLGGLVKLLNVPVVTVITSGAFTREPLYNGLQKRRVPVSARVRCLLDRERIAAFSREEINRLLREEFNFDAFAWQKRERVIVNTPTRADHLERILYRCPSCHAEGKNVGRGTDLTCGNCGRVYRLEPLGEMRALEGETEFPHIPDWYAWERQCVREELERGDYVMDIPVEIAMLMDHHALYMVGEGRLRHTSKGFLLEGCNGRLRYEQKPKSSYSLNADYYWYELGDVIGIGDRNALYYCFPKQEGIVTKARLATEELYRIEMKRQSRSAAVDSAL
ncbi:MAG: hypothetical protein E7620_02615 [Ruminococcaceae bacterium]|nr:hypothetical protein [Oscillospiraceae bacterium]